MRALRHGLWISKDGILDVKAVKEAVGVDDVVGHRPVGVQKAGGVLARNVGRLGSRAPSRCVERLAGKENDVRAACPPYHVKGFALARKREPQATVWQGLTRERAGRRCADQPSKKQANKRHGRQGGWVCALTSPNVS